MLSLFFYCRAFDVRIVFFTKPHPSEFIAAHMCVEITIFIGMQLQTYLDTF